MRCDEILQHEVTFVRPGDHVHVAATKMREANIGFLPVCEEDSTVVGVLTDRDLAMRIVADQWSGATPVRDVMTTEGLVTCRPDDELEVAADLMREHQVERVVITDEEDRLLGVVSLADVVHYASEDKIAEAMRDVTDREVTPS